MNSKLVMHSSDLPLAVPLSNIQKALNVLKPYAVNFNRLSVDNSLIEYETSNIVATLETIQKNVSSYVSWQQNALLNIEKLDDARSELKNLMNIASIMEQPPQRSAMDIDPRSLLRLETLSTRVVPTIASIWFTFLSYDYQHDITLKTYVKLFVRVVNDMCEVLRAALSVFDESPIIKEFSILGIIILDETCDLKFELHDHVVAFSEEEIAEQKRLEKEAEDERIRIEELEAAKALVKEHADTVLSAYQKHQELGNLKKFSLTEQAIIALKDPKNMADLDLCTSLYRLLMAMSNSVRYMPGDEGSDMDRIMGSFMELENDVLSYGQQFTVYLHEYDLSHDDVVRALMTFSAASGKIVAQYVDTKEYLEEIGLDPKGPKTIHLLVMK